MRSLRKTLTESVVSQMSTIPVSEEQIINEAGYLSLSQPKLEGHILKVKINGHDYGYEAVGMSAQDMEKKFREMLKYSSGKALAWLKKNSKLVSGSKKIQESRIREGSRLRESEIPKLIQEFVEALGASWATLMKDGNYRIEPSAAEPSLSKVEAKKVIKNKFNGKIELVRHINTKVVGIRGVALVVKLIGKNESFAKWNKDSMEFKNDGESIKNYVTKGNYTDAAKSLRSKFGLDIKTSAEVIKLIKSGESFEKAMSKLTESFNKDSQNQYLFDRIPTEIENYVVKKNLMQVVQLLTGEFKIDKDTAEQVAQAVKAGENIKDELKKLTEAAKEFNSLLKPSKSQKSKIVTGGRAKLNGKFVKVLQINGDKAYVKVEHSGKSGNVDLSKLETV